MSICTVSHNTENKNVSNQCYFVTRKNQICTLYTNIKGIKLTPWVHEATQNILFKETLTAHKMIKVNGKNFTTSKLEVVVIVNIKPNVARKIVIIH